MFSGLKVVARSIAASVLAIIAVPALAQPSSVPPRPVLVLDRVEQYVAGGGATYTRWRFDVANKQAYPEAMFAASPDLPPCGLNKSAARTWVDFFAADDRRLYGFCALGSPDDLGNIWFATPVDQPPPSAVFVVLSDRRTNRQYRSELVDMSPEALVRIAAARRAAGELPVAFRLLERAIFARRLSGPVNVSWYEDAIRLAAAAMPD